MKSNSFCLEAWKHAQEWVFSECLWKDSICECFSSFANRATHLLYWNNLVMITQKKKDLKSLPLSLCLFLQGGQFWSCLAPTGFISRGSLLRNTPPLPPPGYGSPGPTARNGIQTQTLALSLSRQQHTCVQRNRQTENEEESGCVCVLERERKKERERRKEKTEEGVQTSFSHLVSSARLVSSLVSESLFRRSVQEPTRKSGPGQTPVTMATNRERSVGHMTGFYPFAFSSMRNHTPFDLLANSSLFGRFGADLPKEMAALCK